MFDGLKKENLHHANLLVGDNFHLDLLKESISNIFSLEVSGNPDFHVLEYDTLTIDLARDLAEISQRKDFGGNRKIFILQINIITEEAQNALLKIFEEPTEGTYFFILMPQDILLPTFRSRLEVIKLESPEENKLTSILKKSFSDRLALVKEITDGISDEEKTKQDAVSLLNQVESELYKDGHEKNLSKLKVCELTRASLYDRGAPVKMILENLMLSI